MQLRPKKDRMSFPDYDDLVREEYDPVRNKDKKPLIKDIGEGQQVIFIDKGFYNSLNKNEKKNYLKAIGDYIQKRIDKGLLAPEHGAIWLDAVTKNLATAANPASYGFAYTYNTGDFRDTAPCPTSLVFFDSNMTLQQLYGPPIIGVRNSPEALSKITEITKNFIFEHEKRHAFKNASEVQSDYYAAWETLEKYRETPEIAMEALKMFGNMRVLQSMTGPYNAVSVSSYGSLCKDAIDQAIKDFNKANGDPVLRTVSYSLMSRYQSYEGSSLAPHYNPDNPICTFHDGSPVPPPQDPYLGIRLDQGKYDENTVYDRLSPEQKTLADEQMKSLLKLPGIRNEIFTDTTASSTITDPKIIDSLFKTLNSDQLDNLLKIAVFSGMVAGVYMHPEIAVRQTLEKILEDGDVRKKLDLGEDRIKGWIEEAARTNQSLNAVIYAGLSYGDLRILTNIAGQKGVFDTMPENVRHAFSNLKAALQDVYERDMTPAQARVFNALKQNGNEALFPDDHYPQESDNRKIYARIMEVLRQALPPFAPGSEEQKILEQYKQNLERQLGIQTPAPAPAPSSSPPTTASPSSQKSCAKP